MAQDIFSSVHMEHQRRDDLTLKQESTEPRNENLQSLEPSQYKRGRKPDSPYAYLVCFCGVLCNSIAFGCSYSYGLLLPVLLDEFKEGKAKTAWVGSLAYASGGLFGPVVGVLCDRFNFRLVAFCGGLLSTAALVATSQAPSLTLMFFTYGIVFGFGSCCVYIVVMTIMPRYFIKRRSLATGLAVMGPGGGLLLMSPIIQALLDNTTWRMTFLSMAGIMALICILSCSFDPNIDNECTDHLRRHSEKSPQLNRFATLNFSYLREKKFLIYLIASSTMLCGLLIPVVHTAQYCRDLGIDASSASRMYFYNGLASSVLRALTGCLCDLKRVNPQWIMQIGMVISGILSITMGLSSTYEQLVACFVVYGGADGVITSSMNILVLSTLSPEQRCQGFGFFHCCLGIAAAAGPPFGGFVADWYGSYKPTFYIAGSLIILPVGILCLTHCNKLSMNAAQTDQDKLERLIIVEKETVL